MHSRRCVRELLTIDVADFFFPFPRRPLAASSELALSTSLSSNSLLLSFFSPHLQAVLSTFGFHFIYSLTLIHTLTTLAGMKAFQAAGEFFDKRAR